MSSLSQIINQTSPAVRSFTGREKNDLALDLLDKVLRARAPEDFDMVACLLTGHDIYSLKTDAASKLSKINITQNYHILGPEYREKYGVDMLEDKAYALFSEAVYLLLEFPSAPTLSFLTTTVLASEKQKNKNEHTIAALEHLKQQFSQHTALTSQEWFSAYQSKIQALFEVLEAKDKKLQEQNIRVSPHTGVFRLLDLTHNYFMALERTGLMVSKAQPLVQKTILWLKDDKLLAQEYKDKKQRAFLEPSTQVLENYFLSFVFSDLRNSIEEKKLVSTQTDFFLKHLARKKNGEFIHTDKAYNFFDLLVSLRLSSFHKSWGSIESAQAGVPYSLEFMEQEKNIKSMLLSGQNHLTQLTHKVYKEYEPYLATKPRVSYHSSLFWPTYERRQNNLMTLLLASYSVKTNTVYTETPLIRYLTRKGEQNSFYMQSPSIQSYLRLQLNQKTNYQKLCDSLEEFKTAYPVYYKNNHSLIAYHQTKAYQDTVYPFVKSAFNMVGSSPSSRTIYTFLSKKQVFSTEDVYKKTVPHFSSAYTQEDFHKEFKNALTLYTEFFPKRSYRLTREEACQEAVGKIAEFARFHSKENFLPNFQKAQSVIDYLFLTSKELLPPLEHKKLVAQFQEVATATLNGSYRQDVQFIKELRVFIEKKVIEQTVEANVSASLQKRKFKL